MAFFAVMLPDALSKPDDLKATIRESFKGLDENQVRAKQAEMTKLGQLVRDAVVAAAVKKGTAIPASGTSSSGTTPAPAAAAAATPTPAAPTVKKQKYNDANDVRNAWKKIKKEGLVDANKFTTTGSFKDTKTFEFKSLKDADSYVDYFLKHDPDFTEATVDSMLNSAKNKLKLEDIKKKLGGSRHRTPRNRRSQKRSMKH